MNCRSCQYELSQCLDGRLPSGRRAAVMRHVAECESCATLHEDLQEAQQLVLRLPRQRVRSGFRDSLWERIEAGEGTPPAVFQEPVPLGAKVRYVISGAAAAVLMLAVLRLAGGTPAVPAPGPEPRPAEPSGAATTDMISAFKPLTPALMAREAAVQLRDTLTDLGPAERPRRSARETEPAPTELLARAAEVRWLCEILANLKESEHIRFEDAIDKEIDEELRLVIQQIDDRVLRPTQDPAAAVGSVRLVLRQVTHLRRLQPGQLYGKMDYSPEELVSFQMRWSRHPKAIQRLFVCLPDGGAVWQMDPRQMLVFRAPNLSDCPPGLVAPRSQIGHVRIEFGGK